jgi:hypothetical protein
MNSSQNTNHKEKFAMINYSTIGSNLKRGLLRFTEEISDGFSKPIQKFIADMVYGMVASNNCKLTEIGRALKEDIALKKTVERLGRNLAQFSEQEALMNKYLSAVRPVLGNDTMLIVDGGDVIKPKSPSMEAIGSVYDGSKGKYGDGYWTMGAVALTENGQPIPVYEKLYPCKAQGGAGFNEETKKVLQYLRESFEPNVPRIFDRGFDSGDIMKDLTGNKEKFILRANQNRVAVHYGKTTKINDIVRGLDCRNTLTFHSKTGNISSCRIGMTQIVLPKPGNLKLNLVVCKGFGETPLVLYTNIYEDVETFAVRVVKAYLMRWRIEEFYSFKKQGLCFEGFRVRGLEAIKTLDLLLTVAIGYLGTLCAKANTEMLVINLISISKRLQKPCAFLKNTKFFYYAVLDGISCVFSMLRNGISRFFIAPIPSPQLCLPSF